MKNKEKTAFLNVESKKTIYLQRSNRRVEPTRASDIHHLGHTFVAWHSEAVKYQWCSRWLALLYPGLHGK